MKKAGLPDINKSTGPRVRTSIETTRQLLQQSTGKQGGDSQSWFEGTQVHKQRVGLTNVCVVTLQCQLRKVE